MPRTAIHNDERTAASQLRPIDLESIVAFLCENLGKRLLALTVGVDRRTVDRWMTGSTQPQFDQERKLRDAYQVFRQVESVEAAPTVRAWFMGMNPQLDDLSPAEAISEGRARETLAAARAFVNAG